MVLLPIIKNNLETEMDIQNYKEWASRKPKGKLKSIKKLLETDKKYGLKQWEKVDFRIQLIEQELNSRTE